MRPEAKSQSRARRLGFLRPGRAAAAGGPAERVRQRPPSRDASRVTSDLAGPPFSPAASLPIPAKLAEPPRGRCEPPRTVSVRLRRAACPSAPRDPERAGLASSGRRHRARRPRRRPRGASRVSGPRVGYRRRARGGAHSRRGGADGGAWFPPSAPFCGCETRK